MMSIKWLSKSKMDIQSPKLPKDYLNLTKEEERLWNKWYQDYRRYVLKIQKEYKPKFNRYKR